MLRVDIVNREQLEDDHANYTFVVKVNERQIAKGDVLHHNRREGWQGLLRALLRQLNRSQNEPVNCIWTTTMIRSETRIRQVGWYFLKQDAIEAIECNDLDIYECGHFPHAVVECIGQGVYCDSFERIWFEWVGDEENGKYVKLEKAPEKYQCIVNWKFG